MLKKVPRGKVTTYRHLAHALGSRAYRAVGQAMKRNPNAPRVPCHRVVRSDGTLGGYAGGVAKKKRLLTREGVRLRGDRITELKRQLHTFGMR